MGDVDREEIRRDLVRGVDPKRVICEVLREIYDEIENMPDPPKKKIEELLVDAMIMSKSMAKKLQWYFKKTGGKAPNPRLEKTKHFTKKFRKRGAR